MGYLTKEEYNVRLKKIKRNNESKERKYKLKEEKNKGKSTFKLPSTSKLIASYLFLILNVVLVYAMVAMWYFKDLTYLGVLITDIAAQVLTYLIYSRKSTVENSVGGITYDMAMAKLKQDNKIEEKIDDSDSDESQG